MNTVDNEIEVYKNMKVLLQGDLGFMPFTDLLQWIEMNRKSCVVSILHEKLNANLYLEDGNIIYVSSLNKGLRLGEFLVQKKVINESLLLHALSESRKAGKPLTDYLIERRHISQKILTDVLSQLVEMVLMKAFQISAGPFSVSFPLPDSVTNCPTRIGPGKLIFDSVRRLDEEERDRDEQLNSLEKINKRLMQEDFQLPVLPNVILQLLSVLEDDNSTFNDMVRIIMTDQVLTSRILKVANSSLYASGGQIDSIHLAIARMGMREIMSIATAVKLNSMDFPNVPKGKLQVLLDDALKTAFIASGMARHCRLDPEEAFLAGLLHDMGKTVIYSLIPSNELNDKLLDDFIANRHAEIGAMIAKKWNYPETIQNLILNHHNCSYSGKIDRLTAVIQLTDTLLLAGSAQGADPIILSELKLEPGTVQEIYRKAIESFNNIKG